MDSFVTSTAPAAPGAGAETATGTESTSQWENFSKDLVEKLVKSNDSLEKDEKREKHEEIKWKYRLLGSTLVQGAHRKVCKPGVLSTEFEKLLNRASVSDVTEMLQAGILAKMTTLKAANDPISFFTDFKTEIVNQAFAVDLKNCIWQLESIENYHPATMDQRLSMVQFLAVNRDHPRFLALLESERTHNMEELHEPDKKKRATKGKTLFIDGEQTTRMHLYNACCNYLTLLRYMYDNAKETAQYKAIYKLFHYWHDAKGIKWLDQRLRDDEWLIHAMILELERTRIGFFENLLLCPELMFTAVEADTELPSYPLEDANRSALDAYLAVVNSQSGSGGNFRYEPKSWNYNNITKAPTQFNQQQQNGAGSGQQSGSTNNNPTGRGGQGDSNKKRRIDSDNQKPDLSKEIIEKFEKMGFLECSTAKAPRMSNQFSTWDNKELCKGFCFKGRHCRNTKEECNKAHIPNVHGLPKADQDWLANFVKEAKNKTKFVEGKGPKKNGN